MAGSVYLSKAQLLIEIGNLEAALDKALQWEIREGASYSKATSLLLQGVKLQVTRVLQRTAPEAIERARLRNVHKLVTIRLDKYLTAADRASMALQVRRVLDDEARRMADTE